MVSIRKRTWQPARGREKEAWIVDYKDLNGVRRLKTFEKKKEADRFEEQVKQELRTGIHVAEADTITVKQAGANWLADCEQLGLERSTRESYRAHLDLHITPFIGELLLTKLNIPTIRNWQKRLHDEGRSADLIKRVTVDLGAILAVAQDSGFVARNVVYESNSRVRAKKKKIEKRRTRKLGYGIDIPMHDEIRAIIDQTAPLHKPMMLTLVFTGMRSSEFRGLPWSAVDFEGQCIRVSSRVDRYGVMGFTKSQEGQRKIPVPPIVINTLREWKLQCPKGLHDLVFPNGDGNLENHSNVIKRILHPAQIAAGVTVLRPKVDKEGNPVLDEQGEQIIETLAKYPGLHAFRHFFASWCINRKSAGGLELSAKEVQHRMGHSSIQQTMDTYGHLFPAADEAESLAEASRHLLPALRAT
ncbi:site-specific integrase [Mesorhizobium sp. B2-7-2]|uniref:tyrosine-type recombinase/integrase n=1 Tax=Mesorhizobium sp. B2-7-2 TaxID=2589908 RepID=UPI00112D3DE0|nr:site-specific integrase [Mesorhizobium sp. B2-7-2]TPJ28033.1 site-specific integrase [Mesorhizobium sp. B2-7-2]